MGVNLVPLWKSKSRFRLRPRQVSITLLSFVHARWYLLVERIPATLCDQRGVELRVSAYLPKGGAI